MLLHGTFSRQCDGCPCTYALAIFATWLNCQKYCSTTRQISKWRAVAAPQRAWL
jgi:hypothetical protein